MLLPPLIKGGLDDADPDSDPWESGMDPLHLFRPMDSDTVEGPLDFFRPMACGALTAVETHFSKVPGQSACQSLCG